MASRSDAEKDSRLLSLPAELRNRIYSYAFFHRIDSKIGFSRSVVSVALEPSLLKTCRQIRNEALPLFYSKTTFVFPLGFLLERFLSHLEVEKLKMIRSIKLLSIFDRLQADMEGHLMSSRNFVAKLDYSHVRRDAIIHPIIVLESGEGIEMVWADQDQLDDYGVVDAEDGWRVVRRKLKH